METGLWGLFLSAFISATLAPGGSEAVLAYLVLAKSYRPEILVIVATVGNTLGAMTTWWLGFLAAKKYPLSAHLPEKQQKGLKTVQNYGQFTLLFSWLPIIGDALCFAGGWLKLPLLSSVAIILLGKLCRYVVIAWLVI